MVAGVVSESELLAAYSEVHEQFATDAAFLWLLRSNAVHQPHYTVEDLYGLERRLAAQLDGLMTAPEESWQICRSAMDVKEAGEVFAAAVLAFRSLDVYKIQAAVEVGLQNDETARGLISALGWLPGRLCHSWIKKFFTSKDLAHKYLAVAACSVRREDPRDYLAMIFERSDCLAHPELHSRALRLVGELKRRDLMPAAVGATRSEDPRIKFWAVWATVMLGDRSAVADLQPFVLVPGPYQRAAIELAFRVLPVVEARAWISALAKTPVAARSVIQASAVLGDPQAINWLITQMRIPALTRLAGEAFTTITGIDLTATDLALKDLPDLEAYLPNEDPDDDNVAMDEDDHLPFPDVDKVSATWQKYQQRFVPGQRYFMGRAIEDGHVRRILATGFQRQRRSAALELALMQSEQFLVNCSAKRIIEQ